MKIELLHWGDQCAPGIIIDDILFQNKKTLFMLGIYSFNNILAFLKDDCLENIYDSNFLEYRSAVETKHTKYGFIFNHDYLYGENKECTNYGIIKARFDKKINHFRETMEDENTMALCINITSNVDALQIDETIEWLQQNKKGGHFHMILFTDKPFTRKIDPNDPSISVVSLQNTIGYWWSYPMIKKNALYNEFYTGFIQCLQKKNIAHSYPLFFTPLRIP